MPADHINIQPPEAFDVESFRYRNVLEIEKLRVELTHLRKHYECLQSNLEAIFTRIERRQTVELHYDDGRVFEIAGKEKE